VIHHSSSEAASGEKERKEDIEKSKSEKTFKENQLEDRSRST
jgi:hypothetical protein